MTRAHLAPSTDPWPIDTGNTRTKAGGCMSRRGSSLYHRDDERSIEIHIYEELIGDSPQDIRLESVLAMFL